jgi:hypothetical protein
MPEPERKGHDAARNRFLAACSLTGASTTAYRGGERQDCWLDIARLGPPDAEAILILCCGFQGAEGFCGSAILTHWLNQGPHRAAPRDIGVVLIHAILPAGTAAGGATAPDDAADRDWSDNVLRAAARRFARYARSKGLSADAPPPAPDGARDNAAWLADAFKTLALEVCEHANRVGLLEFHTSMRPLGDVAVMSPHAVGGAADRRVMDWFGDAAGARNEGPAPLDSFALGFGDNLTPVTLTAAHVDYGVHAMQSILRLEARQTAAERRADIRALFFPSSESWRATMRENGVKIINQALQGLAKA